MSNRTYEEEIKEGMLVRWRTAAPNLTPDMIIASSVEDPAEIAIRFAQMRRGSIKHGDYRPIQMRCVRPTEESARTKTPIDGLSVCGVSTYPGRLGPGGPGYPGASEVAEDLGVQTCGKPSREMESYIKNYLE